MSMTDPIADLLTRIRNAHRAKHDRLDVPASKVKLEVCRILKQEGYIKNVSVVEDKPSNQLRIVLSYTKEGEPGISRLRKVSTPGRRVYRGADAIKPVLNGLGIGIVSTSKGLMTDRQAREQRVGGEILCEVW
ncbi:MAG TPA: 30S ribosomal protein S8 [Thermoanaerobaculia bacterium]|jgi:small subunit ribosomal protein S8|nr:30S ribosomal protein S8 [Thermoanaerobaculia bacterium]